MSSQKNELQNISEILIIPFALQDGEKFELYEGLAGFFYTPKKTFVRTGNKVEVYEAYYERSKKPLYTFVVGKSNENECFVATAVYQDPLAEPVELYRYWRDQYLKKNQWGQKFVHWYYQAGGGKYLARLIDKHPSLRLPAKAILDAGTIMIKFLPKHKEA